MTDSGIVAAVDPGDAFARLASETRVAILRALWDADGPLAFAELRAAAGVEDSGKFNYHVGQFDGQFVASTPDGYRLTQAGVRLVGALVSGTYTSRGTTGPVPIDGSCPACGDDLTFEYVDEHGVVDCASCGCLSEYPVPPGVLADRDADALPEAVQQYAHSVIERASRGVCPRCEGAVDARLTTAATTADPDASSPPAALDEIPMARSECRRCGHTVDTTVHIRLVRHPAVVSFLHDHGVDYRDLALWEVGGIDADAARFVDRDPPRASVTYRRDGDALELTVDESVSVVSTDRRST